MLAKGGGILSLDADVQPAGGATPATINISSTGGTGKKHSSSTENYFHRLYYYVRYAGPARRAANQVAAGRPLRHAVHDAMHRQW